MPRRGNDNEKAVSRLRQSIQNGSDDSHEESGNNGGSLLNRRMARTEPAYPQTSIPTYQNDDDDDDGGYEETENMESYDLNDSSVPDYEHMPDAREHQSSLDEAEAVRKHNEQKRSAYKARIMRGMQYIFIAMCLYLGFLIYGVLVTSYDYDPGTGQITAQTMSVRELAAADEFRRMQAFYLRSRWIYEETLRLDFKLHNNPDSALIIATEYEVLLESVAKLSIDLNAASFASAYNQLHAQLSNWVRTDTAVYLQNISAAIVQNSQERANNAIISREIMYTNFLIISENIATYGKAVKGVSLGDVFEWSPERFVREELEGIEYGG